MVEFGEQLRRAREEKGMTQQTLAEQLFVSRQSVSRWECGDRYPDLITTKKLFSSNSVDNINILKYNDKNSSLNLKLPPIIKKFNFNQKYKKDITLKKN